MQEKVISRRNFLGLSIAVSGAILVSEALFVGLRFLCPRSSDGEFGGIFNLGAYDQFPMASVTPVENGRFYLVRLQDGGFLAVYRRCTHLGCSVPYDPSTQQFICPCHGSAFTMEGDVINPPAPRPLDLFSISIADSGDILVDTGAPLERDSIKPEHIIYA